MKPRRNAMTHDDMTYNGMAACDEVVTCAATVVYQDTAACEGVMVRDEMMTCGRLLVSHGMITCDGVKILQVHRRMR